MQIIIDAPWENFVLVIIILSLWAVAFYSQIDMWFYRAMYTAHLKEIDRLERLWDQEPECGCECCKLDKELAEKRVPVNSYQPTEESETPTQTETTTEDKGPGINRLYQAGHSAIL